MKSTTKRQTKKPAVLNNVIPFPRRGFIDDPGAFINKDGIVQLKEWLSQGQEMDIEWFPDTHEALLSNADETLVWRIRRAA